MSGGCHLIAYGSIQYEPGSLKHRQQEDTAVEVAATHAHEHMEQQLRPDLCEVANG